MSEGTNRRLILVLWVFILLGGAWLRFVDLGKFSFWTDELFHVFAAQSHNNQADYVVPFKGPYHRARIVTDLTALSFRLFGQSEMSARLPFAVLNLSFIALAGLLVSRLFSPFIGLIFGFLLTFMPLSIELARECRMYTSFQSTYFFGAFAFLYALESWQWKKRILWGLAAAGFLALAFHFQLLAANFALVAIVYSFICGAFLPPDKSHGSFHRWRYLIFWGGGVLAFGLVYALNPQLVRELFTTATSVPATHTYINPVGDWQFYRHYFMDQYPAFFFLSPLGAFFVVRNYGRKGILVAVNFLLLFFLHSVVFQRKADRYVFYLMPFFLLCVAVGLDTLGRNFWSGFKMQLSSIQPSWARLGAVVLLLPVLWWIFHPWLMNAYKTTRESKYPDWKIVPAEVWESIKGSVILAANPKEFFYYSGIMPNYYFDKEDPTPGYVMEPGWVLSESEFLRVFHSENNFVVVTARFTTTNKSYFTDSMNLLIQEEMVAVPLSSEPEILIFRKKPRRL
ncbi:MAG: hypothetical protein KCHDKBKB_01489 [Elusimicrobia bacterium]|nr:hypothetical protein [Elusimicrobiota bacterium]